MQRTGLEVDNMYNMMMVVEFLFVDELLTQLNGEGNPGVSGLGWRIAICACTADLVTLDSVIRYILDPPADLLSGCATSSWHVADRDMPGMPVVFHDRSQVKRAKPRAIEGCCRRQSKQKPPTQDQSKGKTQFTKHDARSCPPATSNASNWRSRSIGYFRLCSLTYRDAYPIGYLSPCRRRLDVESVSSVGLKIRMKSTFSIPIASWIRHLLYYHSLQSRSGTSPLKTTKKYRV